MNCMRRNELNRKVCAMFVRGGIVVTMKESHAYTVKHKRKGSALLNYCEHYC